MEPSVVSVSSRLSWPRGRGAHVVATAVSLRTDDCRRDAERLKAEGVVFVKEPAMMDYGGMDAVFDDTFGNLINLHQH
jgi:predicted enzyme related to lactoylglutathione lyase